MRARRHQLRLSPYAVRLAGGPSRATLLKIETGQAASIKDDTKNRLERVLRWSFGSVDAVLAGGEPALSQSAAADGRAEVLYQGSGEQIIIDIVTGLGDLTDADRREILALIRAKHQRRDE